MTTPTKIVIGSLAGIGAVALVAFIAARYTTLAIYSPMIPNMDIIKIRGSTIMALMATGGGESEAKSAGGFNFPIAVRLRMFDTTPSFAELAYESFSGQKWDTARLLSGPRFH